MYKRLGSSNDFGKNSIVRLSTQKASPLICGSNFKIFPLTAFEFPTFNFCSSSLLIFFFNSIIIDELLGITPSVKAEMYFEN